MNQASRVLLVITFFLIVGTAVFGEELPSPRYLWTGDVGFAFSKTTGNSDTTNLSLIVNAKRKLTAKLDWTNSGFYLLGKSNGEKNAESLGVATHLDWHHSERLFSFYELQAIHDPFKDYIYRLTPNAGLGYKVVSSPTKDLALLGGISGVFVKYDSIDATDSYAAWKFGNQFGWKISPTADLKQAFEIDADFAEASKFFTHFQVDLSAALTKRWSMKFSFIDNFDNKPISSSIKKNDAAFLAGVALKF